MREKLKYAQDFRVQKKIRAKMRKKRKYARGFQRHREAPSNTERHQAKQRSLNHHRTNTEISNNMVFLWKICYTVSVVL